MAEINRHPDQAEAISEDEITGTEIPQPPSNAKPSNAFAELMSRKAKPQSRPSKQHAPKRRVFMGRDGLGAYTADPESWPATRVIYHNDRVVVINDMYPKSSVHTLVLPKSPRNVLHPFDAFDDPRFLAEVKEEVEKAREMVANELRRRFGRFSATERPRLEAMEMDDLPEELPPGRDWAKEVIAGIHESPSMNHLHVHVMSKDMVSECMKKHNHYQSFTTPFLVRLEEFPLPKDDPRRKGHRGSWWHEDMRCWRCGTQFEKMPKLKQHLEEEFERWKRE